MLLLLFILQAVVPDDTAVCLEPTQLETRSKTAAKTVCEDSVQDKGGLFRSSAGTFCFRGNSRHRGVHHHC